MEQIIKKIYEQAKLLGVCELFTGEERTLDDIVGLFTTPQGIEFCVEKRFPNMATFRLFKEYGLEKYGIYIDAGSITLYNPSRAILIGRTTAVVNTDTLEAHEIILMRGAKAIVNASGWAVCRTTAEKGCSIIINTSGHAVICDDR